VVTRFIASDCFDTLTSQYKKTEQKRDAGIEQINQIMIWRRKIE
jgi:hypothetical protein